MGANTDLADIRLTLLGWDTRLALKTRRLGSPCRHGQLPESRLGIRLSSRLGIRLCSRLGIRLRTRLRGRLRRRGGHRRLWSAGWASRRENGVDVDVEMIPIP